jgi:hypothetical protein
MLRAISVFFRAQGSLLALVAAIGNSDAARADIIGLVPGSYSYNTADAGSPPLIGADSIQLTTGGVQQRSIWFYEQQSISAFTATFTYQSSETAASFQRQGITFAIHANPAGTTALGSLPGSSQLGYGGLTNSVAVTLELDTGSATSFSGVYTNGVLGGGSALTAPLNAFNGEVDVTIFYQGSLLSVTISDGANTFGPSNHLVGNLAAVLGSSTGWVGFTAATEGGANQLLSEFRFVPEPSSWALISIAGSGLVACCLKARRRGVGSRRPLPADRVNC